jgi:hypothetical protein
VRQFTELSGLSKGLKGNKRVTQGEAARVQDEALIEQRLVLVKGIGQHKLQCDKKSDYQTSTEAI